MPLAILQVITYIPSCLILFRSSHLFRLKQLKLLLVLIVKVRYTFPSIQLLWRRLIFLLPFYVFGQVVYLDFIHGRKLERDSFTTRRLLSDDSSEVNALKECMVHKIVDILGTNSLLWGENEKF